jgi:hypothetical protein
MAAHTVLKMPSIRDACAVSPPRKLSTSVGSTGMITPSASMSSTTVMKMKMIAARRGWTGGSLMLRAP